MWWWFLQNALVSGLLAAAVAAVCRLSRFSPAVKHALWLIVLIKLVTPPLGGYRIPRVLDEQLSRLTSDSPRQQFVSPSNFAANADKIDVTQIEELWPPLQVDQPAEESFPEPGLDQALTGAIEQDRAGIDRATMKWVLVSVWLAGAVVLGTVQLGRLIRLWRFVRQSASAPVWLERMVHQTAARLHVRPPQVAVVSALCSPMVCSLARPRLLWPARLSDRLARDAHEAVLLHELAHLRRRDHWVAWLELVAGVIWWFNPIYWLARWQLRENAELACDAWVVAQLPEGRRAYAHALVEVTEFVSSAPVALPAVAMGNIARTSLERRLTMILRERFSYRVPLIGSGLIGLAMLAVLPGWSRGQQGQGSADNRVIGTLSVESANEPSNGSSAKPDTAKSADDAKLPDEPKTAANGATNADALPDARPHVRYERQSVTSGEAVAGPQPQPGRTSSASGGAAGPAGQNKTPSPGVTATWSVVGRPASADRRIEEVEAKLAQLLAEIQQLRANGGVTVTGTVVEGENANVAAPQGDVPDAERPHYLNTFFVGKGQRKTATANANNAVGADVHAYRADQQRLLTVHRAQAAHAAGEETDNVETLTRVKYKLAAPLAQAAQTFIEQYCKADIMAKAEGDTLTIIASPEDQNRIDVLVQLLRDSGRDTVRQVR